MPISQEEECWTAFAGQRVKDKGILKFFKMEIWWEFRSWVALMSA